MNQNEETFVEIKKKYGNEKIELDYEKKIKEAIDNLIMKIKN